MATHPPRPAPRIGGVLETSLYVADLDRACDFYQRLFGLELMYRDGRMGAFAVVPGQVLLLFLHGATSEPAPLPGGVIPPHGTTGAAHLCFAIPLGELAAWEAHLAALDIGIESRVIWKRGGTSLYFRDPDGNSLEVATPGLWPNF
jgi:catechol 2,3-dioxygenase-like lactoylglutathione lyase family enzyme